MAWTYSDYVTYDVGDATRLTRLRLHVQEVLDTVHSEGDSYSADSVSKAHGGLLAYVAALKTEEKALEEAPRIYEVRSHLMP